MLLPFGPINSLGTFQVSANWGIPTQCSFFVNAFGIELLTISPTQREVPLSSKTWPTKHLRHHWWWFGRFILWPVFVVAFRFPGSEEAFAGYQRHARACAAGDEATSRDRTLGLAQMYHRDLQRDFAVAALAEVEIRDLEYLEWLLQWCEYNINVDIFSWLQESSRSNEFQATY